MNFRMISQIAVLMLACAMAPVEAQATDLPAVKASEKNKVAECATPGRLMAFLKARNDKLDTKFEDRKSVV